MDSYLMPKNAKKYVCEKCDFKCSKLSNWNIHINTLKHKKDDKMIIIDENKMPKNALFVCDCGKQYKYRQGLHKHKNKCSVIQEGNTNIEIIMNTSNANEIFTQKMIETIMLQNKDFMISIMDKVSINQQDFMNKMIDVIAKLCGISKDRINIKGKTTEKLGIIGKEKAIACEVITSVIKYD